MQAKENINNTQQSSVQNTNPLTELSAAYSTLLIEFNKTMMGPAEPLTVENAVNALKLLNKNKIIAQRTKENLLKLDAIDEKEFTTPNNKQNCLRLKIKFQILAGNIFSFFESLETVLAKSNNQKHPKITDEQFKSSDFFSKAFDGLECFLKLPQFTDSTKKDKAFYKAINSFLSVIWNQKVALKTDLSIKELSTKILSYYRDYYQLCAKNIVKLYFGFELLKCYYAISSLGNASQILITRSFNLFKEWEGVHSTIHKTLEGNKSKSTEQKLEFMELNLMKVQIDRLYNTHSILSKNGTEIKEGIPDFDIISATKIAKHVDLYEKLTSNYLEPTLGILKSTNFSELYSNFDYSKRCAEVFTGLANLFTDFNAFYQKYLQVNQNTQSYDPKSDPIIKVMKNKNKITELEKTLIILFHEYCQEKLIDMQIIENKLKQNMEQLESRVQTIEKDFNNKKITANKNGDKLVQQENKEKKIREARKAQKNADRNLTCILNEKRIFINGVELHDLSLSSEEDFEEEKENQCSLNPELNIEQREQIHLETKDKQLTYFAKGIRKKITELDNILMQRKSDPAYMNFNIRFQLSNSLKCTITEYYQFFDACLALFALYERNNVASIQKGIEWSKEELASNLRDFYLSINKLIQDFQAIYFNCRAEKEKIIRNYGIESIMQKKIDLTQCTEDYIQQEGLKVFKAKGIENKKLGKGPSGYTEERRFFNNMKTNIASLNWLNQRVKFFVAKDNSNITPEIEIENSISYSEYQIYLGILLLLDSYETKNFKFVLNYFETLLESFQITGEEYFKGQANYYLGKIKEIMVQLDIYPSKEEVIKHFSKARELFQFSQKKTNPKDLQLIEEKIEILKSQEAAACLNF